MDNDTSNSAETSQNVSQTTPQAKPVILRPRLVAVARPVNDPAPDDSLLPDLPEGIGEENKTAFMAQLKKYLIAGGCIFLALILIVAGSSLWDWYNKKYIPEKDRAEARELTSQAQRFQPQERITFLKKIIAENPGKNKKNHVENLIREAEEEIKQEKLRQEQEARRREEQLRQEQLRQEKLRREQAMQEKYQQALTQNHSENIYVIKEKKLPPCRIFLFQYDTGFEVALRQLQQKKQKISAFNDFANSVIALYRNGSQNNSVDTVQWDNLKKESAEAEKILPHLTEKIASDGERLILDADDHFYSFNSVYCRIPNGKWIICAVFANGSFALQNVVKSEKLPLFLKLDNDKFKDVSQGYYNEEEKNMLREKKLASEQKAAAMQAKKLRLQNALTAVKETVKPENTDEQTSGSDVPENNKPGNGSAEIQIRGLIFFADLQNNSAARGGIVLKKRKKTVFGMVDGVPAIKFSGEPDQALSFKWQVITGNHPRTVSVWFYCAGYNRHDGGNPILSYGRKNFGEYFDIETNRSKGLHCAWGEPHSVLAENIQNDRWNHFAVTYDGNKRICYLNGEVSAVHEIVLKTPPSVLMIGARLDDTRHCFVGSIRNVAVYNRALNAKEIKLLNNVK